MGCSKSSSKSEVYSNTFLPQEIRKTSNRPPNITPKTTEKRRTTTKTTTTKNQEKERNHKDLNRDKLKRNDRKKTVIKINKTESVSLRSINNGDKALARLSKKKRERAQINKIRNEKGEVTSDTAEAQRIIRNYYMQINICQINWTTNKKRTNSQKGTNFHD